MLPTFRSYSVMALTGLLLTFSTSSCIFNFDREYSDTPVTIGSVEGNISPVSAVAGIGINAVSTPFMETVYPNQAGLYSRTGLEQGEYIFIYTVTNSYREPVAQRVTIKAKETVTVPAITVTPRPSSTFGGTGTYVVGGSTYAASSLRGTYQAGKLSVYMLGPSGTSSAIDLRLPITTGPANFTLDNTSYYLLNSTVYYVTTGTVNLSTLNQSTRLCSGTFSFTGRASSGATITVSNGTFNNVPY
ncbi:DUF6252 family protein [Hymenobacter sp. BT175]|uniref:DUF6252 family protein n=1 Tax=Hymenobacter translucens TaxID=2886507 RepID=UPI001D0F2534|nr:DUF6252 family protein [Hymenobacter translucens]MCC2546594.1 DUF6252 family protein [Hymenobacter translucens]